MRDVVLPRSERSCPSFHPFLVSHPPASCFSFPFPSSGTKVSRESIAARGRKTALSCYPPGQSPASQGACSRRTLSPRAGTHIPLIAPPSPLQAPKGERGKAYRPHRSAAHKNKFCSHLTNPVNHWADHLTPLHFKAREAGVQMTLGESRSFLRQRKAGGQSKLLRHSMRVGSNKWALCSLSLAIAAMGTRK